jgi:hypothetical protein
MSPKSYQKKTTFPPYQSAGIKLYVCFFMFDRIQVNMHHMINVYDTHVLHMVKTYGFFKKSTQYVLHMVQTHVFHMFFIRIHMNNICFSHGRKQCFSKKRTLYVIFMV